MFNSEYRISRTIRYGTSKYNTDGLYCCLVGWDVRDRPVQHVHQLAFLAVLSGHQLNQYEATVNFNVTDRIEALLAFFFDNSSTLIIDVSI